MSKVIATLLMLAICTPVWSGELDGKGLWCSDGQGFFFVDGGFEAYILIPSFINSDGVSGKLNINQSFTEKDTSYQTTDFEIIMYFESQGYETGILVDRTTLKSKRFGMPKPSPAQCEVLQSKSDFKKRLIEEKDIANKQREEKMKKRKI